MDLFRGKISSQEKSLTESSQSVAGSENREPVENPTSAMVLFRQSNVVPSHAANLTRSPSPPTVEIMEDEPAGESLAATVTANQQPAMGHGDVLEFPSTEDQPSVTVNLSDSSTAVSAQFGASSAISSRLRKRKQTTKQEIVVCSEKSKRQKAEKGKNTRAQKHPVKFDATRFSTLQAQQRYDVLSKGEDKFIKEKIAKLEDNDRIRTLIDAAGMMKTVTDIQPFDSKIIWEFWANLPPVKVESNTVEVHVRDWVYEFSPARINQLFGLEDVDFRTHRMQMAGVMDEDLALFMTGGKMHIWKDVQYGNFTADNKILFKICCSNWSPSTNDAYAQGARARVIYMIANKTAFNFGKLVFDHILQLGLNPQSKFHLPFPSLVYRLLMAQHPIPMARTVGPVATKQQPAARQASASTPQKADLRGVVQQVVQMMQDAVQMLQDALNTGGDDTEDSDV